MASLRFLTIDEFILRHDESNLLSLAGIGGPNSVGGRTLDRARLEAQLARAEAMASGYLYSRYPALKTITPDQAPEALKGVISDLAIYYLRDRIHHTNAVEEETRNRYRDCLSWLKDVQAGRVSLGLSDGGEAEHHSGSIAADFGEGRADKVLEGYQ
ncbi:MULTISPECIES: DUF1320 domain-containing protein [Stappiaceae]|uniref:DUF1320 domain-containing protein n=1 Tax=Stappiaceae TaxID=2821832 RepID=UPI000C9CD5C8|nr:MULTISPECIES: DUF1320 domain-containing protein [Pseudovibrio]MDX5595315.1 DUF1320 domain-containing protein [Pseudovibrio sp. SPO723]